MEAKNQRGDCSEMSEAIDHAEADHIARDAVAGNAIYSRRLLARAYLDFSAEIERLRADNASLTAERDQARDELTTLSCSAGYTLSDQRKCIVELTGALREATALLVRYRRETPLGNQPHMIAHVADDFLARSSKAMEASNGN